ncbi:tetratricopeptide repeat protein, partial [Corynebacterium meridianum]
LVVVVVGFYGDGVCVVGCFEGSVEDVRVAVRAAEEALKRRDFDEAAKQNRIAETLISGSCGIGVDLQIASKIVEARTALGYKDYERAAEFFSAAEEMAKAYDESSFLAACYLGKGRIAREKKRKQEARRFIEWALGLSGDGTADAGGIVHAQSELELGIVLRRIDKKSAGAHFEKAHRLFRTLEDEWGVTDTTRSWANLERDLGNFVRARDLFDSALRNYEGLGDKKGYANCLHSRGILERKNGNLARALEDTRRAVAIYKSINGDEKQKVVANCKHSMGNIYREMKDYGSARNLHGQAKELYESLGYLEPAHYCVMQLGILAALEGETDEARTYLVRALEYFRENNTSPLNQALCLKHLGILASKVGNVEEFFSKLNGANELYGDLGSRLGQASILLTKARFFRNCGDWIRTDQALKDARRIYASPEVSNMVRCAHIDIQRARLIVMSSGVCVGGHDMDNADVDIDEKAAEKLRNAIALALPAVVLLNRKRFTFVNAADRILWANVVQRSMGSILLWSRLAGTEELIVDLIETAVNAGIHQATSPALKDNENMILPESEIGLEDVDSLSVGEVDHVDSVALGDDSGPGGSKEVEPPSLHMGGGSVLIAGARLCMAPPPQLQMPDGHIALEPWIDRRYGYVFRIR